MRAGAVAGSILSMRPRILIARSSSALALCCFAACALHGQAGSPVPNAPAPVFDPFAAPPSSGSLLTQPTLTPGALVLLDLERKFAADVAKRGGAAFATWFADDAVELSNGRAAKLGRGAIAADATWDPAVYHLTWTPTAAQMGPSNDMGFTWGHYEGRSKDAHGEPVIVAGRYITVWKKLADGTWRVALDAGANEPPATGDCCALPKP
jgi:ketosteroid isomerase-like protein